jgi:hypothetical protein
VATSETAALVLDDSVTSADGTAIHFANFGGLFVKGQPVAVSLLGFDSDEDAYAAVEAAGLPLVRTTVSAGEGSMPSRENHYAEGEEPEALPDAAPELPAAEMVEENADELIGYVAKVTDLDTLDGLEQAEKAGKSRTTVLAAIDLRRQALTEGAA